MKIPHHTGRSPYSTHTPDFATLPTRVARGVATFAHGRANGTKARTFDRGDSGGTWFFGTKAMGITSGFGKNEGLFSGIGSLNLLGLTVIVS